MSKQPWKKVLYVQQDYEDNYVDETFLNDLEKNLNLKTYELGFLVKESSVVAQEVTSVVLFVSLFCHLERSTWDPLSVLLGALVIAAGGHVCCYLGNVASDYWLLIRDGLKGITFVILLFVLSPILESLTESISTDTIYAMTTGMFVAHLTFHNYGSAAAIVSGSVSLNAAVFGAICLSSRLPSTTHVFALMLCSLWLFAVLPKIRGRLKEIHESCVPILAAAMFLPGVAALGSISTAASVLYILSEVVIVIVCPWLFVRLQSSKNVIYGPWDEAHPVIPRTRSALQKHTKKAD
jgi:phosphatidylinositol glycan class C protein